MKNVLLRLATIVGVLLAIAVAAIVVVLVAAGLGSLLASFLPFSVFEATLLSLITLISLGVLLWHVVAVVLRSAPRTPLAEDEEDDWEDDEDEWGDEDDWGYDAFEDEDDEDDKLFDASGFIPSTPRQQPPISQARFEKVGRNEPCPCGSGRKYKNCHGRADATSAR